MRNARWENNSKLQGKLVFLLQNIRSACGGDVRLFGWFVSATDRGLSHKVKHGIRWLAKEVLKMGSEPVSEKDSYSYNTTFQNAVF